MLLRPERLSLPQLQRHCGSGGDGALNLHPAPMAALEVSGGSVGPLDPGTPGGPTPAAAAVDRHLSGVGLYPTAGRELHPRGHPVGRRRPGQGPAQVGTPGTYSVDSGPQPSPNVNHSIPFDATTTFAFATKPTPSQTVASAAVRCHPPYPPPYCLSHRDSKINVLDGLRSFRYPQGGTVLVSLLVLLPYCLAAGFF